MSNAGQAVLGIVGAVVGFVVGGPTGAIYGFQLGYLAGTALFPTQLPHMQGPRLGDGQQTASVVGQPIPWIFGTQTVGGNIIWASPIREVANTETQGGKGGPEQDVTTYTYYRSWAILLCEGPIGGVRRVWANGKIVYDASAPTLTMVDPDDYRGFARAFAEVMNQIAANANYGGKMTIYTGTEDQLPDPVIESFEGVGNVPAHRGYAYVVFDDIELKAEDGNRMPGNWKFEVYEEGTEETLDAIQYANEVLYPWMPSETQPPMHPLNDHRYTIMGGFLPANFVAPLDPDDADDGPYDSLAAALAEVEAFRGVEMDTYLGYNAGNSEENLEKSGGNEIVSSDVLSLQGRDPEMLNIDYNSVEPTQPAYYFADGQEAAAASHADVVGDIIWEHFGIRLSTNILQSEWGGIIPDEIARTFHPGFIDTGHFPSLTFWFYSVDAQIQVQRLPVAPADPCDVGTPVPGLPNYAAVGGVLYRCGPWELDESTTYRVLQRYDPDTFQVTYPLGPARPLGHLQYDSQPFWEAYYEVEVARGRMPAGLVYGVDYPQEQAFGYRKTNDLTSIDAHPVSIASIVRRVCERAGVESYDVSDLEDRYVIGYQVSRPMAARAAIEPLRSIGFFDAVESDGVLKFPIRGKPTVARLTEDDIGCHMATDERPPSITTRKKQEFEMPRQIRVHFQNPERDYDPGEELSPARFDTRAESVLDVDVGAAITPDQAAQIAEVLYRDFWAARWSHDTSVDQSWSFIEPADCIEVPIDGRYERVRVPALVDKLPNLRSFELLRDDDGSYISLAVGTESQRTPDRITFYGPVDLVILDLPPLSAEHDDAGVYAAVRPSIIGSSFRGAVVSRSPDGGNYTIIGSLTTATPSGTIFSALPSGPTTIFDEGNELIVELIHGELESRSESDVLGGANAAAIGVNGRWEILQFKTAEPISDTTWRLSGFLRGRKGTEHSVGTSVAGDTFVMLSTGSLARLPLEVAELGLERLYKATPIGTSPEGIDAQTFTGRGIALKPFSPVHVEGERDVDGNLSIDWVRRDRLATDLDVPMSETVEDYEVDILSASGEVLRTISVSDSTVIYTAEQQTLDFGSLQAAIDVRVYQISEAVGRGYAAEATI